MCRVQGAWRRPRPLLQKNPEREPSERGKRRQKSRKELFHRIEVSGFPSLAGSSFSRFIFPFPSLKNCFQRLEPSPTSMCLPLNVPLQALNESAGANLFLQECRFNTARKCSSTSDALFDTCLFAVLQA